jgi:hypothetical protein
MAEINIGDTVEVRTTGFHGRWRGEVLGLQGDLAARVMCIDPRAHNGMSEGLVRSVRLELLSRAGDPDGMRPDGCDDVDVTGRVRPMHRHAVSGRAHAHPNGGEPHTHQTQRPQPDGPPDPVEVVAERIAARRMAENIGPSYITPGDTYMAEQILAALVSGPWHLVTGQRQTGTVMHLAGGGQTPGDRLLEIHQEWKP